MSTQPSSLPALDVVAGLGWPASRADDSIVDAAPAGPVGWQDVPRETSSVQEATAR